MQAAVLIPALNEAESLPGLLRELTDVLPDALLLVVDNGSSDGTGEVARKAGARVVRESRRGYGAACLAGISELRRLGPPERLIIIDADHADDPTHLPRFIEREKAGVELVLSTRTQGGAEPGSLSTVQLWGNQLQTLGIRLRFGLQLTDMGPMRVIRWAALERMQMRDETWGWNVEMACKAARLGLRVEELPVPYRNRQHGESKISGSLIGAARAGAKILYALARYAR